MSDEGFHDVFFELHHGLPREGPGDDASTLRASLEQLGDGREPASHGVRSLLGASESGGPAADSAAIARRLHLLLPLVTIVVLLALGRSPMRAAFWGVMTAALMIAGCRLGVQA